MREAFKKALYFRHACKIFDEEKKISDEDMRYILEAGRLSPSSFGMEGWKFLVIRGDDLKKSLRPLCWNQIQITSCSHLVIILAEIEGAKVESGKPRKQIGRRGMSEDKLDAYIQLYSKHLSSTLKSDEKIYEWMARQSYIAGAFMMMAAACIGIDSCPIEGFEKEKVEELLGIDTKKWQLSLILPFGYRVKDAPSKLRLPFDEVVEFID